MKKILVLLSVMFVFSAVANAQSVQQTYTLFNGTTFITQTDSVVNISATYGNTDSKYWSQTPDSVTIEWFGKGGTTGDSVGVIFKYRLRGPLQPTGDTSWTYTTLDSITAKAFGHHALPATARYAQTICIQAASITTGHNNAVSTSAYPSKLYAKLVFWYTVGR